MLNLLLVVLVLCFVSVVVKASTPRPDTSEECVSCQKYVESMNIKWGNATSVKVMTDEMKATCAKEFNIEKRKMCDKIVDVYVQIPPAIFDGEEDLAWPIPLATCATFRKCTVECCAADAKPEQVHLSLAATDRSVMGVTYVTLNQQTTSVQYGTSPDSLNLLATGDINTYKSAGWVGNIHKTTLRDLAPATTYFYRVGGDTNAKEPWSDVFSFKTLAPNQDLTFAVVADMAYDDVSTDTIDRLVELTERGEIDVLVHSGDISYADGFEPHWDDFFNKVQPIAARIPYMVTPGNHEFWYNFKSYKSRFFMPGNLIDYNSSSSTSGGSGDSMYYSWSIGPIHFVSMNSETAIDVGNFADAEIEWLKADVASVDRTATPWLIANFHRPLYCSYGGDCSDSQTLNLRSEAEEIFYNSKVDVVISGHVHAYERTYPVYNNTRVSTSYDKTNAPVYLLQGASGNREGNKGGVSSDVAEWTAKQCVEVGFGIMKVPNSGGSIEWSFHDAATGAVLDHVVITK